MRIRLGVSSQIPESAMAEAIDAALEASAAGQVPLLKMGRIPDIRQAIKKGRVKWKPEPPGDEHFDDAATVLKRGWGDCDDLAPWLAASMRASGEAPDAFPFVYKSGAKRWHAVVDRGDGKVLDPSKWAGMGRRNVNGIGAAAWPAMFPGKLSLATHPHRYGWAGRVDIPDAVRKWCWSIVSHGTTPKRAVRGAIQGAVRMAETGDTYEDDLVRLIGLNELLRHGDVSVVGDVLGHYGDEYVGFLPALLPAAASLASPLLKKIMPGGGGGKAPAAAPSGGGGGGGGMYPGGGPSSPILHSINPQTPGTTMSMPGGPIIVRF